MKYLKRYVEVLLKLRSEALSAYCELCMTLIHQRNIIVIVRTRNLKETAWLSTRMDYVLKASIN